MPVEVSIVVPSYREEENLRLILPRIRRVMADTRLSYEMVIVDTMEAMDETETVCRELGARYLPRSGGNSYGDAVRSGIAAAEGRYTVFMDADGSHTPEFLPNLLEHRSAYEVVIASRYVQGGGTEDRAMLVFMSRLLNLAYSLILNLNCKDVSNGYKLYRTDLLKAVPLSCSGFDVVEEILYKLNKRHRIRIKELPYSFKRRMFGESKRNLPLFILFYLYTLIRLRLGW
ncbi:MAG: glycosyltransferase [Armatimonadetes bacterium]|nr:glycosyltransferase [Armatimonadota bacterium]